METCRLLPLASWKEITIITIDSSSIASVGEGKETDVTKREETPLNEMLVHCKVAGLLLAFHHILQTIHQCVLLLLRWSEALY